MANFLTGNSFFRFFFREYVGEDKRDSYLIEFECMYFHDCCLFFFQTMSQSNFLLSLQSFAKDTINDEMVELLAPYLEMEDYNMETAKRVSNGCILA